MKEDKSTREIGEIVKKPHTTVQYIVTKYKKQGNLERPGGSGRPKKINTSQAEIYKGRFKTIRSSYCKRAEGC